MSNPLTSSAVPIDPNTAGYQRWRSLLFLHWAVGPDVVQKVLPAGLSVETFDRQAWLGLVPFAMQRVRPWWSPPIPGISWFLETNLRTYVKHRDGTTGVWFFSLDANSRIAVLVARKFWGLNYRLARLALTQNSGTPGQLQINYVGERTSADRADYHIAVDVDTNEVPNSAKPGTLDQFLIDRYRLFCQSKTGNLATGVVHHSPYQFWPATIQKCEERLSAAANIPVAAGRPPDHAIFSPGVNVRVSPLRAVDSSF